MYAMRQQTPGLPPERLVGVFSSLAVYLMVMRRLCLMAEILHAAATLFSSPLELSSTQQSSSVLQRHFPVSDITAAKISDVCLKIALNLFRIFITVFPPTILLLLYPGSIATQVKVLWGFVVAFSNMMEVVPVSAGINLFCLTRMLLQSKFEGIMIVGLFHAGILWYSNLWAMISHSIGCYIPGRESSSQTHKTHLCMFTRWWGILWMCLDDYLSALSPIILW